ncbi:hypothetical protein M6B38_393080 [Iris pallida]|uniref:Uncharacterized protein n=1 Tax=Iris pallida TaxID=29817 RepID=A0AAX6FZ69_IRIPA|nr:hypothetical protein M6B38_393080 [Iris pallida]
MVPKSPLLFVLYFIITVSYSISQFTWNCCWCLYLFIFLTGYVDKFYRCLGLPASLEETIRGCLDSFFLVVWSCIYLVDYCI